MNKLISVKFLIYHVDNNWILDLLHRLW